MRVLVTGSDGYIGTNLAKEFKKEGIRIIPFEGAIERSDIVAHNLDKYIDKSHPDAVIHLAAISGVEACQKNPDRAIFTNVSGTFWMVEKCRERDVPLIFMSSTGVTPLPDQIKANLYLTTKWVGEHFVQSYEKGYIIRCSNAYGGPNYVTTKNSVIAKWIKQAKHNRALFIYGTGYQTRDFIHVSDVCRDIVTLFTSTFHSDPIPKITYSSTGQLKSINQLSELFKELTTKKLVFAYQAGIVEAPTRTSTNTIKADYIPLDVGLSDLFSMEGLR